MSLVEASSLMGGVIGSPVSLDVKKVNGAPPPTASRPPQQPALITGGGATAPPARAATPLAIKRPVNSAPTTLGGDTMAVLPPISKSCDVMSSVDHVICYLLLMDSNIINTRCIMISGVAGHCD